MSRQGGRSAACYLSAGLRLIADTHTIKLTISVQMILFVGKWVSSRAFRLGPRSRAGFEGPGGGGWGPTSINQMFSEGDLSFSKSLHVVYRWFSVTSTRAARSDDHELQSAFVCGELHNSGG
jgi:hypothetical protein